MLRDVRPAVTLNKAEVPSVGLCAVLVFLLVVPAGTPFVQNLGAHDASRVAQLLVSAVCAIALTSNSIRELKRSDSGAATTAATITLLALSFLSVFCAANPSAAARELSLVLGLACVVAVVGHAKLAGSEVMEIIVVAAALLFAALVLMIVLIAIWHGNRLDPRIIFPGYENYRFFNHVQTVALPLLVIAARPAVNRRRRCLHLAWAALTLSFSLLYFTQGRATGVALLGGSLLSLWLFGASALPALRRLTLGAAAGALLYVVVFVLLPSWVGHASPSVSRGIGDSASYHERLLLWNWAIGYAAGHALLGVGPMHYANVVNPIAAHPHNIYLQVICEWGYPVFFGTLAMGTLAAVRMAQAIRACKEPDQQNVGVALFIAALAAGIDGAFSGNLVMPVSQVWVAFAIGWAFNWVRSRKRPLEQVPASVRRWPLAVSCSLLAAGAQVWLWCSIWPEVADLASHLDRVREEISRSSIQAPRFWSNGWF